jgi:hypothetical protein
VLASRRHFPVLFEKDGTVISAAGMGDHIVCAVKIRKTGEFVDVERAARKQYEAEVRIQSRYHSA